MKVTDYKMRIIDRENMLASFEINFDYVVTIKDILLLTTKDGKGNFIAMPSKSFTDKETGEVKYKPQVSFSEGLSEYLRKFCEKLYQREKEQQCS
jgi:DNA-binding cell septation regulator SpoVG